MHYISRHLLFALSGTLLTSAPAFASGIDGYTIVGQWGNLIEQGYVIDAKTGYRYYLDNQGKVVDTINNGSAGSPSTITNGKADIAGNSTNTVSFQGNTIPSSHGTTPFALGSIYYFNGTTNSYTDFFAATLSFYAEKAGAPSYYLGKTTVAFNSTSNDGDNAMENSDYLTFSGLSNESFNAYEQSGVTGTLDGLVIGDPYVKLTGLTVNSNQSMNGYVGANPTLALVPLPPALPMLAAALLAVGSVGYGRKRRNTAAKP